MVNDPGPPLKSTENVAGAPLAVTFTLTPGMFVLHPANVRLDAGVENDELAGSGTVNATVAVAHVVMTLLPTTCMSTPEPTKAELLPAGAQLAAADAGRTISRAAIAIRKVRDERVILVMSSFLVRVLRLFECVSSTSLAEGPPHLNLID